MNINPFIVFFSNIIFLYSVAIGVWVVLSWLVSFQIINQNQPFVNRVLYVLSKIIEPLLSKIRKILPVIGGIDLSPIVAFLLLQLLDNIMYTYFYK
jgi:YggT family protein